MDEHLEALRTEYPDYHNRPVESFGDADGRLLIVGLAPGMHGANATGRPFTGDYAGILLFRCLHRVGLASRETAISRDDGMQLSGCRITNAVKCLPPENRPTTAEIDACNGYLRHELAAAPGVPILALGTIAHRAVLKAEGLTLSRYRFAHGTVHSLPTGRMLVDSYHCSRYNTQTGRLTESMFMQVLKRAVEIAHE